MQRLPDNGSSYLRSKTSPAFDLLFAPRHQIVFQMMKLCAAAHPWQPKVRG